MTEFTIPKNLQWGIRTAPPTRQPPKRSRQSDANPHNRPTKVAVPDTIQEVGNFLVDALAPGDHETEGRIPASLGMMECQIIDLRAEVARLTKLVEQQSIMLNVLLKNSISK